MIEFFPAHKINNIRFRRSCARFSIRIRGSSGYAGRDPLGGTSDGSVCKLSLNFFYYFNVKLGRKKMEKKK